MEKKAKDRIADALVEMIASQGLEKITVKKLLEQANVNKSTFYYHFDQLSDVTAYIKQKFLAEYRNNIIKGIGGGVRGDDALLIENSINIFQYLYEHRKEFSLLINSPLCNEFRDEFVCLVGELFSACQWERYTEKNEKVPFTNTEKQYYIVYNAYSNYAFLECWAKRGFEESPEELAELVIKITNLGSEDVHLKQSYAK